MEIVNQRQKMLDAMESNAEGNDNFVTKVIITENVEKIAKEVRRKNQIFFFPKLMTWATILKLSSLENF